MNALSALAHGGRLAVFRLLVEAGDEGLPAGEIARQLGVPPNTLSTNLNLLTQAGLARFRRSGRSIIYSASYQQMAELIGFLLADCCHRAPAICAPIEELLGRARCCALDAQP